MSFSRLNYDDCAYNLQMSRSVGPGDYRLYGSFVENCNQCFSYEGPTGSKSDVSLVKEPNDLNFKNMTQVESELSWRNQSLKKCNDNLPSLDKHKVINKPMCNKKLTSEDTRFTNPIDNYRGMSLTSLQLEPYLHVNPQCHIQESGDRIGMNSRLYSKDSYKIPYQKFLDNGESLPKEIKVNKNVCGL